MWGEENSNSAETVTINPWAAGLSQPQAWQGPAAMGRGSNQPVGGVPAGAGAYRAGVGSHQQQRQWDPQQQQLQNNQAGTWAPTGQMAWNQMPPGGGQPASAWHISQQQQQWNPASNSPSGTYADQAKKNMPLPRNGGPPSLAAAAAAGNGPPRLFPDGQQPLGSSNWGGTVKVDQQTPWDTTGNAPPPPQQHAGDWNGGGAGGAGRWGQPIGGGVQMAPPGAATGWQTTGHPNNLVNAPPVTGGADWSAQSPAVLAHRINPAGQHHDTTGTAHWNAGAPPPVAPTSLMMVSTGSVPPPAPGSNWCQPGTGGPGAGGPPPTAADPANRLSYDPNPQTPGPWVAPQPAEMNNDMMWHDPNPKQKKVQRDTGTSVWGDPSGQRGEIRRWKEAETEQFSSAHTAVHANSSNADWATLPLTIPTPAFQAQPNEAQPQAGWGKPPPPQGAQQQPTNTDIGTSGWGAPTPTATTTANNGSNGNGNAASSWLPDTSNSSQDGGNNGDNGLTSEMNHRQSQHQSFGHANPTSTVTKDRPDGSVASSNNHLNPHIEQIQHAVNRKLINVAALTSPAVTSNPQILLDLTKLIKRFMDKEHELAKFQQQQHQHQQSAVYKNEEERLICEINSAKSELAELQRSICSGGSSSNIQIPSNQSNGNPSNSSLSSSTDGQSRLQQWKKTNHTDDPNKDSIGAGLQSLISASQSLSIQSGQENGGGNDWKSGALDWSPPSSGVGMDTAFGRKEDQFLALTSASSVQMTNTMSGSGPGMQQYNHFDGQDTGEYGHEDSPLGGNGAMDDGPLEFVPGKKWEWRDPNKVAEDPNATPGTCKPNPLLSSAMLGHGGQYSSGGQNVTSQHGQGSADQRNFNAWTGGNATPYPTNNSNPASEMWNNKARSGNIPPVGGPPPSGLMNNPPNRLMGPPPSILGPAYPSGNPAGMPPGTANRGQFGPGPSNAPINAGVYWILFQLVNINDQQIQMICSRVGRLTNFMIVGHKIACAKFADGNMDGLMQRLKEAYMFAPQHIKVVPDDEFDKMMRASRASNMPVTNVWSAPPPLNPGSEGMSHWSGNQSQEMMMGPPPMQHFGCGAPMDDMGRPY